MTRRTLLRGGAALAGAVALSRARTAHAGPVEDHPTLVVFWLNGGPAGLFNSAGSFLPTGAFGVTHDNVRTLGNDLYVDAGSLGALPEVARAHMASVNFRHGVLRPHDHARAAVLETGGHSQLLRMAAAMPGGGPIRCALVNDLGFPKGISAGPPAEAGVSLEFVMAFDAVKDPGLDDVRAAYGARPGDWIRDASGTFAAVEGLVRAGASVIFAQPAYTGQADRQFDTHGDDTGVVARTVMAPITPLLAKFLERTMALPGRNVVTMLVGEFSRTVPASDHEPGGTATVIGKHVRTGTAGPQRADGSPPDNAPPPEGLWAYAAAALRLRHAGFGKNPNPELIV
ncbi:MAG TPA: hypothetical protein VKE22_11065 [Haliangiales bacterium]|nr:hypothetical protein [Haliangiales bacterium]